MQTALESVHRRIGSVSGDFLQFIENGISFMSIFQLFAASFPLAPLIALVINLVDIKIDAKRMIWMYKRPVGCIAQDIGWCLNNIRGFAYLFSPKTLAQLG